MNNKILFSIIGFLGVNAAQADWRDLVTPIIATNVRLSNGSSSGGTQILNCIDPQNTRFDVLGTHTITIPNLVLNPGKCSYRVRMTTQRLDAKVVNPAPVLDTRALVLNDLPFSYSTASAVVQTFALDDPNLYTVAKPYAVTPNYFYALVNGMPPSSSFYGFTVTSNSNNNGIDVKFLSSNKMSCLVGPGGAPQSSGHFDQIVWPRAITIQTDCASGVAPAN